MIELAMIGYYWNWHFNSMDAMEDDDVGDSSVELFTFSPRWDWDHSFVGNPPMKILIKSTLMFFEWTDNHYDDDDNYEFFNLNDDEFFCGHSAVLSSAEAHCHCSELQT